ncbi:unnamed protein product [Dovyalis caffra]|uniref:Uncharacterized protein n=1 Tax=Dovyalis caffra TaxID=77055 RepID=A0AAV1RVF0_9ROSI|nr:unnamed protein product [Dovyalis caffra]
MAPENGLTRFSSTSIVLIILILVWMPLVHSSRSCLRCHATVAAGDKARNAAEDHQTTYLVKVMGNGAASGSVADEESERQLRQVPSGPDPLHHNNTPTTRP